MPVKNINFDKKKTFMRGEDLQRQTGINIPDTGKGKYLLHFLQQFKMKETEMLKGNKRF